MEIFLSLLSNLSDNIVTITLAIISGIYVVATNTKKYELTENYRREIMSWHKEVVQLMIEIIHSCRSGDFYLDSFSQERNKLLANLSALAEIGRLYFPNILKNEVGKRKPSAYRGYRHIAIKCILKFYYVALDSNNFNCKESIELMWKFEREFTSFIFDMFKPRIRNKEYSKYLSITIPEEQSKEDSVSQNTNSIKVFR